MDRESAIKEVGSVLDSSPDLVKECLSQLAKFRKRLSTSRTLQECDAILERASDQPLNPDDFDGIIEALVYERAMEILQAEEAEKQPVASDDPFGGRAPLGG